MNKWKVAFFVSSVALIASLLVAFYIVLDQGVSYTYLQVSYDDQTRANEVLGRLIVKGGQSYSQQDFLHLLRLEYPDAFIVETENKITMDANEFVFQGNKLVLAR